MQLTKSIATHFAFAKYAPTLPGDFEADGDVVGTTPTVKINTKIA